jgi:hypothetical protein
MAIATDPDPEDIIARVIHEWHQIVGAHLQIQELQTFESKTTLTLFNIFTSTNKKILLAKLEQILTDVQAQVQEHDPSEFWWNSEEV